MRNRDGQGFARCPARSRSRCIGEACTACVEGGNCQQECPTGEGDRPRRCCFKKTSATGGYLDRDTQILARRHGRTLYRRRHPDRLARLRPGQGTGARHAALRTPEERGRHEARHRAADAAADAGRQAAHCQVETAAGLQGRGLRRRHRRRALPARGRQGHGVRVELDGQQRLRHRHEERKTRDQDAVQRPRLAERHRLQERHALHRRARQDFQGRRHREPSRQSAAAREDLRRPARPAPARLASARHRPRQPALCRDRRALQHLHAARHQRADPQHESGRRRREGGGARRAQLGRLRLEPGEQTALLHRQRPRLDVGGYARTTSSTG